MCGPEAMFAGQAVAQLGGALLGQQSDEAAHRKKVAAINQEADALDKSVIYKFQLTQLQKSQIMDRDAAIVGDARLKLDEAQGAALAAAATGGVEGPSVEALLNSFAVATGKDIMFTRQQTENELRQVDLEERGIEFDANNRKASLRMQLPEDPTPRILGRYLSAALGVGKSFIDSSTPDKSALFGRRLG